VKKPIYASKGYARHLVKRKEAWKEERLRHAWLQRPDIEQRNRKERSKETKLLLRQNIIVKRHQMRKGVV
jgi:hypothetical protein